MWVAPVEGEPVKIEDDDFVSIIWIHHSMTQYRSNLARASLCSIIETTKNLPCEIIVVDNGGNVEDGKFFLELANENKIHHYIRNGENLHFAYARNQGLLLAGGKYISIIDNDIIFDHKWLQLCVGMLEQFPDRKFIASIIYYPYTSAVLDKRYHAGTIKGKHEYKLNQRAGANCMVMRREVFDEVGLFQLHRIAGSHFVNSLVRAGYLTILPPEKYRYRARDCGFKRGYKSREAFPFIKTLSDGSKKHYGRHHFSMHKLVQRERDDESPREGDNELNQSS